MSAIPFQRRVISGLDDVEQRASGAMYMDSSDLELVDDGSNVGQWIGLRFTGIDIPKGATITKAYLQFQVDEVGFAATSLVIRGQDGDNAAPFANVTNNVSSRPTTDASTAWTPAAWTTVGESGLAQRTPDLSAIVQEIVARGGWLAGNDMAFVITGSGTRTAEAYEGGAARAPLLHIEWSPGEPDTTAPTVLTVTIDNSSSPPPPPPPTSGIIRVPEDYATIQEAVNAAGDGDTVLVGPGTYSGGIVISGKSITLASHYHTTGDASLIDQTIISDGGVRVDASAPNTTVRGFHFVSGSDPVKFYAPGSQALDNFFDNTGAHAISFEDVGGIARGNRIFSSGDDGVDVDAASGDVLIENNIIESAGDDGIEIRNQNYTGPLVTLTMRNYTIVGSGEDGIQLIDYSANSNRAFVIERNLIRASTDVGLGIMDNGETTEDFRAASMPERIHVFNNTFDGNPYGITGGDNLIAVNNIISNSSVLGVKNIDANSTVAYTLFFGNRADHAGSNVDAATTKTGDPLYTSTYELQPGSPAVDAQAPSRSCTIRRPCSTFLHRSTAASRRIWAGANCSRMPPTPPRS
jgi:hypothetical protein